MNCSAPMPGPRRARSWWDESTATPPARPVGLRAALFFALAIWLAIFALAFGRSLWS